MINPGNFSLHIIVMICDPEPRNVRYVADTNIENYFVHLCIHLTIKRCKEQVSISIVGSHLGNVSRTRGNLFSRFSVLV